MRNDTIINVAGLTILLQGETRTFATVTINGHEYTGEVGNSIGRFPDEWLDCDLLLGLEQLNSADFAAVCDALSDAML
jgi:hypothetical protein